MPADPDDRAGHPGPWQLYRRRLIPPVWLLLWAGAMWAVDRWLPLVPGLVPNGKWPGLALISAGVVLEGVATWQFRHHSTNVLPFQPATVLLTTGVYRFSRNPIYVGMTLVLLGWALVLGSLGALLLVPLFPPWIQRLFIHTEEAMLETTFGDAYRAYAARTRRWL